MSAALSRKDAKEFYEAKLKSQPEMARYNHFMAALRSEERSAESQKLAKTHYETVLRTQPHNIMARNDYALHLARNGCVKDSAEQFGQCMLMAEDQPTIRKNFSAVLARTGNYVPALEHATRAVQLNPNDAMNHRNLAKIYDNIGDSRSSLKHNMTSIQLEDARLGVKPNTSAYRAAAVQIIGQGGSKEEAQRLMDAARNIEGKMIVLPTSTRTYELIAQIAKRQGDKLKQLELEGREAERVSIADITSTGQAKPQGSNKHSDHKS